MKKWIVFSVIVVVLGIIGTGLALSRSRQQPELETVAVERTDLTLDIDFTGRVQPTQEARLGFESTGTARAVNVDVGDSVNEGQQLAYLDTTVGNLEVAKAYADRVSARADAQLALQKAQTDLTTTEQTTTATTEKARQAVRNAKKEYDQAQQVWEQTARESGDTSSTTQSKYSLVLSAESAYKTAQRALKEAEKTAAQTTTAAKATVTAARATVTATEQAAASVAGLSSLEATEELARVRLSKTTLVAPFSGIVTKKEIASGEVAVAGSPLITVATLDAPEIVAQVPETDITKIRIGMDATVTFEAYEATTTWAAEVVKQAPAAEIIEGVPTYTVTLRFQQPDQRLLSGLTADITVHADHRTQVLAIPRRTVLTRGDQQIVRVVGSDGHTADHVIQTGLVDSSGLIEVTSGLHEGQLIVRQP